MGIVLVALINGSAGFIPALAGLFLMLSPVQHLLISLAAADYLYILTQRRLIIYQPALLSNQFKVLSYGKRDITELTAAENSDGSGDLIFRQERHKIGFFGIANVREVRQLILNTFEFEEHDFWSR
jgi:hypothetical protein